MGEMVSKSSTLVNAVKCLCSFWFENLKRTDHLEEQAYMEGCYRCAEKSLARPGRKQATVTEDFEFHILYL